MGRKKLAAVPVPAESAPVILPEPPDASRAKQLSKVAAKMTSWRPARQVLTRVKAVPTIFPWSDYATRVRGFPTQRIIVVHGPSAEGKTQLALGYGLSFLKAGHYFLHVDAEYTTPASWLEQSMGEHVDNPLFLALRPKSYEQVVDAVRDFLKQLIVSKKEKAIPEDASALIVIDSLRKLTPENFLAKLAKQGSEGKEGAGVDGMRGMGAAVKAAMNANWFDELTPLLYHSGAAMLIIARESENREKGNGQPDWKLTGGRAVLFEGSLMIRVERDWERIGQYPNHVTIGERHDCYIYKSKVAGKDDREEVFSFWTSNGRGAAPEGFDVGRDLFELGVVLGAVKQSGGWFSYNAVRWQGKERAVKRLTEDLTLRARLEADLRKRFEKTAVSNHDPVTGELPA
jgi:RecA/RadA recombinase